LEEKVNKIHRVFISHTSEFTQFPDGKSFVNAAIAAVIRASCFPYDMGYFTARDEKPAAYCREKVRECDVYVGLIGLRYGSLVRDRPDVSYTELEFEAASEEPKKQRLIFLLDPNAEVPIGLFSDRQFGQKQEDFRKRLQDAGVVCQTFTDVHQFEMLLFQALADNIPLNEDTPQSKTIEWPEGKSPYPGLVWFDKEYAPLFFGRDRELDEVLSKMSAPDGHFLLISGASGSGKSSLVAAGLWHALVKEGRLPGSQQWLWLRITPGDGKGPFDSVAWGLKQTFPKISTRSVELADELARDPGSLITLLTTHLTPNQKLLLFIDQLEELFTQGFKDDEIRNFLEHLITITGDSQSRLRVVSTIRSEFIGKLEEFEIVLQKVLNANFNYHLGPVSPRILQEMIEKPAQITGYKFEPHLVEAILDEAGSEIGNLPLVAYMLKQLFEERKGRIFTKEAYEKLGRVVGVIGTKADQVMKELPTDVVASFGKVFAELVLLDRDRPPTRKRVSLSRFKDDAAATTLIQVLAGSDCRVLVKGGAGEDYSVEVAHEKLFTGWKHLSEWIKDSGEALRSIDDAEVAAKQWHEKGGHPQELWSNGRAEDIHKALNRFGKNASPMLKEMIQPQDILIQRLKDVALSHADRLFIGKKLAEFGDTRPGVGLNEDGLPDIEWIEIPGGKINLEDVTHVFTVKPFLIAKYPVTNRQFQSFLDEDGYTNDEWWQWWQGSKKQEPQRSSWQEHNVPRETVTWYEAVAFCRWLSHRTGLTIRLPTEWEWQQAATGSDPMFEYPWGKKWATTRCNSAESRLNRTTSVGIYPNNATQQGVLDMAGNVWEWCRNPRGNPEEYEFVGENDSAGVRVIRGGSWDDSRVDVRSANRIWSPVNFRSNFLGFRLARDAP
jgi:formylglycine-generating enzyme required for sulfatase activity/energy-coupling factor transporter ATP-binding protein EcfA2